ncbi:MAG: bifunctional folylpolyglutamate synthase/dihydrofolate synthase [Deltaproteobacteria bacterium]|nr:bifunctional folylpolyglutamate synthase/dihydrofolate synthase [Deltaproteobacteria bacterium]
MSKLDALYDKSGFIINLGLERITALLNHAGNPQERLKIIHIAGTNGKGSVSRFIYAILKEHGLRAGLYTSPHLLSFNERIIADGKKIEDYDLDRLGRFFKKIILTNKEFKKFGEPSFFELTTAICFKYFEERHVDVAIIEAGLGGRLDATNVVKKPLLSVITNISMDHEDILGHSLKKIALDKAGIIKQGSLVVTGEKKVKIKGLIKERALSLNVPFFSTERIKLYRTKNLYNYNGLKLALKGIKLHNKAWYQKYNLGLALLSVEIVYDNYKDILRLDIKEDLIKKGISKFNNEGRFEIINYKNSTLILDGAHNPDGIKSLIVSLKRVFKNGKFIIIFAVMKDKNYKTMLKRLAGLNGSIIFTGLNNDRVNDIKKLESFSKKYNYFKNTFRSKNIKEGLDLAFKCKEEDDLILLCGSLYLIGEFKELKKNSS